MSQSEVLEFLEKHKGKWWTTKEISEKSGMCQSMLATSFRRLRSTSFGLIYFRVGEKHNTYFYKYKK